MLELVYKGIPMQVINVYTSAKGTAKECRPLQHLWHAHVAPNSRLVLMGISNATRGWSADCVSVNTEITPVFSEFLADTALLPFTHGMSGPTWIGICGCFGLFP